MKELVIIAVMVLGFVVQGWGQTAKIINKNATAAYIAPNGSTINQFEISSGAFFFDATKRVGISNVIKRPDGQYAFKYLGEEQPDAIYETMKTFFAEAGAKIADNKFNAEVFSHVNSLVERLTTKSYALTFLRTALYRINEAAFNEDIKEETYKDLYKLIIIEASKIQQKELGVEANEEHVEAKTDEDVQTQ